MTTQRGEANAGRRFAGFAAFFRQYMHVGGGVLVACTPIPMASWGLLPLFSAQKGYLTVYSSLFCFLLVGSLFSLRHRIAKHLFMNDRWSMLITILPFLFIVLTVGCIFGYQATLQRSLEQMRVQGSTDPATHLLQSADESDIPFPLVLSAYYLGIFVFAECAFIILAIREYLQDAMGLAERALLPDNPPNNSAGTG
jgi:hypothetical protein